MGDFDKKYFKRMARQYFRAQNSWLSLLVYRRSIAGLSPAFRGLSPGQKRKMYTPKAKPFKNVQNAFAQTILGYNVFSGTKWWRRKPVKGRQ